MSIPREDSILGDVADSENAYTDVFEADREIFGLAWEVL